MNVPPTPADAPITLYDKRHARRQRGKALSHVVPALVLLSSILEVATGAEPLNWLRVGEFVTGATYLLLMRRELRHLKHHPHQHERVAWLELAGAAILALEGYHLLHRYHEAELATGIHKTHVVHWVYFGLALLYIGLAFGGRHLIERRFLHLHADGFRGRTRLLQRAFALSWADVSAVEPVGPADLLVVHQNGQRQRISFAGVHDGPTQRDRLLAHAQTTLGQNASPEQG